MEKYAYVRPQAGESALDGCRDWHRDAGDAARDGMSNAIACVACNETNDGTWEVRLYRNGVPVGVALGCGADEEAAEDDFEKTVMSDLGRFDIVKLSDAIGEAEVALKDAQKDLADSAGCANPDPDEIEEEGEKVGNAAAALANLLREADDE